ncbi:MAG TPA: hypothetical protein VLF93_00365 [Candidatus Saccharimonadales bacterium]|nr:hypothetical protein [Candidatus Saccharimonadales bacterium]
MQTPYFPNNIHRRTPNSFGKIGVSSLSLLLTFQFLTVPFHLIQIANADTETNGNYSVDVGNIDTNPQPTHIPKSQPQVLGTQSPKPEFTTGPNYTVDSSNDSFSVTISQNIVDYGILSSTNPVIRTSTISFSDLGLGAEILTYEDHPLLSSKNDTIQNTSCDNGSCTSLIAAAWSNTLTYGFGYRCDDYNANLCDDQFNTSNYFKQYPEISINQQPSQLLVHYGIGSNLKATITNKVNISGTQKATGYENNITYLAIPSF